MRQIRNAKGIWIAEGRVLMGGKHGSALPDSEIAKLEDQKNGKMDARKRGGGISLSIVRSRGRKVRVGVQVAIREERSTLWCVKLQYERRGSLEASMLAGGLVLEDLLA